MTTVRPEAGPIDSHRGAMPPGLVVQRVTTDGIAVRDQYAFWKEVVCGIFVGLDCSRDVSGPFRSAVLQRRFDLGGAAGASFIDVASEGQAAVRSPRQIARATEAWLMLGLQTHGPGLFRQGGEATMLAPGDMVLFDSTRPYSFQFDRPFRQLVLKLPHALLAPRLPRPERWLGRRVAAASPMGQVLASHLVAVSAAIERVEPALRGALIERTADLVGLAFAEAARAHVGAATTPQSAVVARAKRLIDLRLGDPALAPGTIAAALGISPSYLHRLFQAAGDSVGRHIRARRLERCRDDLADPLRAGESVTEIALRWGFNDMPHFSRAFRARFGASPRAWRHAGCGRGE